MLIVRMQLGLLPALFLVIVILVVLLVLPLLGILMPVQVLMELLVVDL